MTTTLTATTAPSYLAAARHLRALIGSLVIMLTAPYEDYDGYGASSYTERYEGFSAVWRFLVREQPKRSRMSAQDVLSLKSASDVCNAMHDYLDYGGLIETEAQFHARKADEQRQKLEGVAKQLAARFNVRVDSAEFIAACHSELERFSDYRQGMREDGLCIGYGVNYEQWSDERNASYGDTEQIHELLDWLASECPLLWAKYENSKASIDA